MTKKNTYQLMFMVLIFYCCTPMNKSNHETDKNSMTAKVAHIDTASEFEVFTRPFPHRKLPYEINVASSDWIDFNSDKNSEIDRKNVIKFLCNKDSNAVLQPGGGYYQYYYGYQFKWDSVIGLIYYRISNNYIGYMLSVFDSKGHLQDSLFLSGVKGEFDPEAQKESVIGVNGTIEVCEVIMNHGIEYSGNVFRADYVTITYRINPNGKITELSRTNRTGVKVKCDKNQKDRVVLVN